MVAPGFVRGRTHSTISPLHPNFSVYRTIRVLFHAIFRLLYWLGVSTKWVLHAFSMVLYICAIAPALIPYFYWYLTKASIVKNIPYGPSFRQQLDVYLPEKKPVSGKGVPVIIFVSGGAWMIGYKCWAFVLCVCLQRFGGFALW